MQLEKQQKTFSKPNGCARLLALQDSIVGKTVVARVIGRDPDAGQQTVTIDKGRSHGVQPDSAVITPDGIVGRVIYCQQFFLDCSTDHRFAERSRRDGAVRPAGRGSFKGTAAANWIWTTSTTTTTSRKATNFITSGLDRIYPKGLPVGVDCHRSVPAVRHFQNGPNSAEVDLGRLEEVLCIIDRPETVDVVDPTEGPPSP